MAEHATGDPLDELRERLEAAERSARRLAQELPDAQDPGRAARDAQALAALLATLRGFVPPELQGQLRDLARQVLLLLRALIDRSLESLHEDRPDEPVVHDIEVSG